MTNKRGDVLRGRSLSSTSLAALALGAAALVPAERASAQPTSSDPDARYALIGPGNVDPRTGEFAYESTDLSVGAGPFPGRLELKRWTRSAVQYGREHPMGDFEHNFMVSTGCEWDVSNYPSNCSGRRAVRVGSTAYVFNLTAISPANIWTSAYGEGATLTEEATRFVFRGPQGDQIIFPRDASFYNYAGTVNLASSWQMANGESVTFSYEIGLKAHGGWNPRRRLTQVVNSRGFGFKFNYILPGNQTQTSTYGYSITDWQRLTVASVDAIAPGCVAGTAVAACDPSKLGHVYYNYSQRAGSNSNVVSGLRLDSLQDPDSNPIQFTWDVRKVASESNPAIAGTYKFQNFYSGEGVIQQIDPRGKTWLYRRNYDSTTGNTLSEVEDPAHAITKYFYLWGKSAPAWAEDSAGRRTNFIYEASGRIKSVETPMGRKTTYDYDGRGNVTAVTLTPAAGMPAAQTQIVTSATYPPCDTINWKICNKPVSTTDARNNVTEYSYSPDHGGPLTILAPGDGNPGSRSLTRFSYSAYTRANGVEATHSTAPLPDVVQPTESVACLSSNNSAAYVCPAADAVRTTYDYEPSTALGRTQHLLTGTTVDPGGIAATSTTRYDMTGNVVQVDGPRSDGDVTTYEFNRRRLPTRIVEPDPDGGGPLPAPETINDYNASGGLTAVRRKINGGEVVTSATLDAAGEPTQVVEPESGTVNITYDDSGRQRDISQTVEGVLRTTRNVYDPAGRLTEVRSAVGTALEQATVTYTYDNDGARLSQTDANGNTTNHCYDGYGRLIETRYPSTAMPGTSVSCAASPAGTIAGNVLVTGYDAAGNVTSNILRDGRPVYMQHDSLNRLKLRDVPDIDRDVTFNYDLLGRMTSATLPGTKAGFSVSWTYDKLGRPLSTTSNGRTVGYSYAGNHASMTMIWPDLQTTVLNSDPLGRTSTIHGLPMAGSPLLATYTYDQLSRRSSILFGNAGTQTVYGYNAQQRLSSLSHNFPVPANNIGLTYTYNEAGELKSAVRPDLHAWMDGYNVNRPYVRNGRNQYVSSGNVPLSYDGRGNLTGDGTSTFAYDTDNRLISATTAAGTTNLDYDALGRLARIVKGGFPYNFLYDGQNMIGEYSDAGALYRRYVHGPGVDEPLVWYDGSGVALPVWYYTDERGSIIAGAGSDASILGINRYDEFGIPAASNQGRFQYTGQMWLSEIGLYYYKARLYSPFLGRFLQTDPIGYADGMNLYAYVRNDPVNLKDPTGLHHDGRYHGRTYRGGGFPTFSDIPSVDLGRLFFDSTIGRGHEALAALFRSPRVFTPLGTPEKHMSKCMQQFMASQGYGSSNLSKLSFYRGDGGISVVKKAFAAGHGAMTIGNNIMVHPDRWASITSPKGGATYFEEAIHTIQWDRSGRANFLRSWGVGSIGGGLFTGNAHNSPLEIQAMGISQKLSKAYNDPKNPHKCPD